MSYNTYTVTVKARKMDGAFTSTIMREVEGSSGPEVQDMGSVSGADGDYIVMLGDQAFSVDGANFEASATAVEADVDPADSEG